jgi:hypothetical protein
MRSDSAYSHNSNQITKAPIQTIQVNPSDSYQVLKVLAGRSSGRVTSGEVTDTAASPQYALAGDYSKINYRNILAHLVDNFKESKNFSSKDKEDFEMISIWHTESSLSNVELPDSVKRNIIHYYYVFLHGWSAALEMTKPFDQQSFGLPPVQIQISNQNHYKVQHPAPRSSGQNYRGRGRGGSRFGKRRPTTCKQ